MFVGFDYGTSNCAIGVMNDMNTGVNLLPLDQGRAFMTSTLYAIERELICEYVGQHIPNKQIQEDYLHIRRGLLSQAQKVRIDEDIRANEQSLFFGNEAFEQYLEMPSEGYFIKSPKSFLGASGLRPAFVHFFEDIVTAMMLGIKQRAEQKLQHEISHTVIGRPVNFQGFNAEKSNQQALDILTTSAHRAGFKSVEFLFEPLAAGLDFETKLDTDKTVLVVDIGGGTSDCAMVRMGPGYRNKEDRSPDFLGHTGERVGGNDLDIQLAGKEFMPLFGMKSPLKNGHQMPTQFFWDAVSTNDAGAQAEFNSQQTENTLIKLLSDTTEPALLQRFINLRDDKQNHQIVRSAEQGKIALSDKYIEQVDLSYVEPTLSCDITRNQFAQAIERPLEKMTKLMSEAVKQAGSKPDLIYMTGGSAKSLAIQQAVRDKFGDIEVVDGDHFGSVAAGLTLWAKKIFS